MATMKAVRIHGYGGGEVLRYEDVPRPAPGDGEVLVRVHAAGVNAVDWKIRAGYLKEMIPYPLPVILGLDFSGTIAALGAGVSGRTVGEAVYGRIDLARLGAYAEYAVVRPGEFTAKPRSLDHAHAAAVPLPALAAWQSMIAGAAGAPAIGVAAGDRVLIHGAAGGVGSFAVQLARWRGAQVVATTRGAGLAFVRELGADQVIDYTAERFEEVSGPVDAVLDLIGGEVQTRSWSVLRPGGTLATTVGLVPAGDAPVRDARAISVMARTDVGQLDEISRLIDAGTLRPRVQAVLPLADAAQALARLESGEVLGKIVLAVSP